MVRRRITWRRWLWAGLASATLATTAIGAEPLAADVFVTFQLKETAGLRRFGYPVHAVLPDPNSGPNFRLERGGKAVPAQFRKAQGPDGRPSITLDFNSSPGPHESEPYTVRSEAKRCQEPFLQLRTVPDTFSLFRPGPLLTIP